MKKLYVGLVLALICAGCTLNSTVRYSEQAREKARYYETRAAILEKQVKRQNQVIKGLKEQIKDAKNAGRYYDKRGKSTEKRLRELRAKTPESEAEKQALSQLIRHWEAQKRHMEGSGDDQENVMRLLQDQLRMQRQFRDGMKTKIYNLRKKAAKMNELADKLKAKEKERESAAKQ